MKKIFLLIAVCLMAEQGFSQSFYKNALVANVNFGIDIYHVDYSYRIINTNNVKVTHNGAAAKNISFGAEYGLANWFGVGLQFKVDNFYTKYDSTTFSTPSATGFEGALELNFHVVRTAHFDLPIGFNLGTSHLQYNENDVSNNQIYGAGSYLDLHINPRFYFKRFGLNLDITFPKVNYSNMTSNNATFNQYVLADWKGSGFGFSFGFQYRFFSGK